MIDQKLLNEFLGEDKDLLADLSIIFARQIPDSMSRLILGMQQRDPILVHEAAHQMKSQFSYFFCEQLVSQTQKLEELGKQSELATAQPLVDQVHEGILELISELNQLTGLSLSYED
jgi:HPt (histidine-containing phosphotransfer) domain-containing protein